ncbi:MAG TPA: MarR family transcriptional regulator, partial [Caulobacteraceae bacterium]|nr:MarR family transcriptional regulator [Caulobacteraceae bacterium]
YVNMIDPSGQEALRDAVELMYFAYRAFTDRADRILERRGLGRVHHRVLYFIGRNPGVSVSGLLEVLAVSKQALNAPLRQLQEMNLVAVALGGPDRRVKPLRLTERGRQLEAELSGAQMGQLAAAFAAAGASEAAGWRAVMAELARDATSSERAGKRTS